LLINKFYDANIETGGTINNILPVNPFENNIILNQRSGGILPDIYIGIFDNYDNLVKTQQNELLEISIVESSEFTFKSYISGEDSVRSKNGLFKFSNLNIVGDPNSTQKLVFNTNAIDKTLPSNKQFYSNIENDYELTVKIRSCIKGEKFKDNGSCESCIPVFEYNLEAKTSIGECKMCPREIAQCLGGDQIIPLPGYYQLNSDKAKFFECYLGGSCLGYSAETETEQNKCKKGYQGLL
jgi:hypothetical protein